MDDSDDNLVRGNYIGTNAAGANLGNGADGVRMLANSDRNKIGGLAAGEGNTIWFNHGTGVSVNDAVFR